MSDDYDFNDDDDNENSRGISRRTGRENKLVRGRPFVAGQSGNPAGMPKVENIKDLRLLARMHTEACLDTLVEVMSDPDQKGGYRVAAANAILDRGWGKPQQNVVIEDGPSVDRLSDDDLGKTARKELAAFIGINLEGDVEAPDKDQLN